MKNLGFWLKLCVFNFFIVSVVGVLMRYKIAFSLPAFDLKFLQESHSHFAFYGWVTACLYIFIAVYLSGSPFRIRTKKYEIILLINLLGSYGMLGSFMYGGYYWLSIAFSSVSLFSGFAFFILLMKDTRHHTNPAVIWLRAGAFFAVISSIGIFFLAYMSAQDNKASWIYRAASYFYLHYQYNGFFLFSCIGLLMGYLKKSGIEMKARLNKNIFYLLFSGAFLGVGLSLLWQPMPDWLYLLFVLASLLQLIGIFKLGKFIVPNWKVFSKNWDRPRKLLFCIAAFAVVIKFAAQSASTVPTLAVYAFYVHNIIIAYLHLVLLVGISSFLLWKILESKIFQVNNKLKISIYLLIAGILLNEFILAISGILSACLVPFPSAPYWLLFASVLMMVSIFALFTCRIRRPAGQ